MENIRKYIREIINEEFNKRTVNKNKEIFNYKTLTNNLWHDKIIESQKFHKINFDLENVDSTGEKKKFTTKRNRKDSDYPDNYLINAELFDGGGDWEIPVYFFKVEIVDGRVLKNSENTGNIWSQGDKFRNERLKFVLIPSAEAGNSLKKCDSEKYDWCAYDDSETPKEKSKELWPNKSKRKEMWKWLEEYLEKAIAEGEKKVK